MKSAFTAGLALAASFVCAQAQAMSFVMPSDGELVAQSDGVLVGTVDGVPSAGKGGALPQVEYRVIVERVLAGRLPVAETKLALPGTVPGAELVAHIPGVPKLQPGQRVLVFFDRKADGTIAPEQLSLGLFMESRGKDGSAAYVRQLDGAREVGKSSEKATYARDAAKFEAWIRATAAKRAPLQDYFLTADATSKYVISTAGDGIRYRWFQFDAGTSVPWYAVGAGMAGSTFNVFNASATAVAAWTNDPGSKVKLTYAGTVASDDGNDLPGSDANNAFVWNDPAGDIAGSHNCSSGVLAIGGAIFNSSTTTFAGVPYHRIIEAFIITQDGAACVFNGHGGADGIEILTHEVGHTLGLNHSCEAGACAAGSLLDEAVMRSYVHRDGRGAALNADDRAGIAVLYPETGVPVTRIFRSGFE